MKETTKAKPHITDSTNSAHVTGKFLQGLLLLFEKTKDYLIKNSFKDVNFTM